jgi:hypothetical protein
MLVVTTMARLCAQMAFASARDLYPLHEPRPFGVVRGAAHSRS